MYRDKLILHSTGDFINDYAIDPFERNDCSFLFMVELDHGQIQRIRLYPLVIENVRVRRAHGAEAGAQRHWAAWWKFRRPV